MKKNKNFLLNNIYDLMKICALPKKQNDDWAKLNRLHAKEATKEIGKYLKHKNICVSYEGIEIGKHIKIIVIEY